MIIDTASDSHRSRPVPKNRQTVLMTEMQNSSDFKYFFNITD